jgi:hypothetical protein
MTDNINKYKLKKPPNIIIPVLDLNNVKKYTKSSTSSNITLSSINSEFYYSYTTCSTGLKSDENNINTTCSCNIL